MIDIKKLRSLAKDFTVLYVEDDDTLRDSLDTYLKKFFLSVTTATNGSEGLELCKDGCRYDLIITDIKMPILDGIEMATQIKEINPNQDILITSAYSEADILISTIKLGIDGYILKPIDYEQLNTILYKTVYKIKQFKENQKYKDHLEKLVEEKTLEIQQYEKERANNYKDTLYALVKMIDDRDTYTGGHSQRVAKYSKMVAKEMGFNKKSCEDIYQAGILHDIGKIAIPDTILLKPNRLNDLEYKLIQEHVKLGVDILKKIPMFKKLAKYIKAHHERLDGSGYPKGLKGDEILVESQILAISDTFDAMTTNRIYKLKKDLKQSLDELESLKGIFFREDVVKSALKVFSKVNLSEVTTQLPTTKLEQERFAYFYKDQITQCYNSIYLDVVLRQNDGYYKYLYIIQIHNLNNVNEKFGWEKGNKYLYDISLYLQKTYNNVDIFRFHGDDFILLSRDKIIFDNVKLSNIIVNDDGLNFDIKDYDILKNNIISLEDIIFS